MATTMRAGHIDLTFCNPFSKRLQAPHAALSVEGGNRPNQPPLKTTSPDTESEEGQDDPRDSPPSYPTPIVTYLLLGIIAITFLLMFRAGNGNIESVSTAFGAKDNNLIRQGQWWRFITPIFLHGSWQHLLVNALSLWQIGVSLERIYGSRKFFVIFIVAGVFGNLFSFLLSPTSSLGASGSLFGLVGAGLVFPLRFHRHINPEDRRKILSQLTTVTFFNLMIGYLLRGVVDNWAHIGGLAGGAFVALFFIPDSLADDDRPDIVGNAVASVLSSGVFGLILFAVAMQWGAVKQTKSAQLVTYALKQADPWWSIGISARWKQKDGTWVSPEGAIIRISSSDEDSELAAEAISLVQRKKPFNLTYDGMFGWEMVEKTKELVRQRDYLIAYGKIFTLTLDAPPPAYTPRVRSEVRTSLESLRFFHSPRQ